MASGQASANAVSPTQDAISKLKIRREDEEQSTQVKRRSEHEGGWSASEQMKVTPKVGSRFGAKFAR
jgi:hypothetical protein